MRRDRGKPAGGHPRRSPEQHRAVVFRGHSRASQSVPARQRMMVAGLGRPASRGRGPRLSQTDRSWCFLGVRGVLCLQALCSRCAFRAGASREVPVGEVPAAVVRCPKTSSAQARSAAVISPPVSRSASASMVSQSVISSRAAPTARRTKLATLSAFWLATSPRIASTAATGSATLTRCVLATRATVSRSVQRRYDVRVDPRRRRRQPRRCCLGVFRVIIRPGPMHARLASSVPTA